MAARRKKGTGGQAAKTAPVAVVHHNLMLVRCPSEEQLDALLGRASVRRGLVRRLGPDAALFARDAGSEVRAQARRLDLPVATERLPGDAAGERKERGR